MKIRLRDGMLEFRLAERHESEKIMELMEQAKRHLRCAGVDQWQKGYPDQGSVEADILEGSGYVLTKEEQIVAYACVSFGGEGAYRTLNGVWLSEGPYAVIHRLAIDDEWRGRGLATAVLNAAESLCAERGVHSIKVDTDAGNAAMRHILEENEFSYCGVICFDNSDKIAFEKLLP